MFKSTNVNVYFVYNHLGKAFLPHGSICATCQTMSATSFCCETKNNRTGTRLGLEAVPPLHAHNQSDTNKSRESKKIGTERLRKVLRAAGVASIRGADALRSQNLVIVTSKKRELWADAGPWGSTTSYESWYQQGYCFCGYPDAITGAVADALIWMESEEVLFDNISWGDWGTCK